MASVNFSPPQAAPAAGGAAGDRPQPALGADGYWLSSLELRCGLDMRVVAVNRLPGAVLREFLRMHESWLERGVMPARRDPEVDIALALDMAGTDTEPAPLSLSH